MEVRWTRAAAADLEHIANYLFEKTPELAPDLIRRMYEAVFSLRAFPNRGRRGKKSGTRELLVASLPYVVVYEVSSTAVHILRILHGAQQWPSA